MKESELAALYRAARVGGDFFEFFQINDHRLVFVLLDIAGRREQALTIAASVQENLRNITPKLFAASDLNEADAVTELVHQLNDLILSAADGVRCAPGFVGCYNETLGLLSYINAGFVPALVRDGDQITSLEAGGLPLGLFSHATHDAQMCVLGGGGALLLASRGLIEVRAGSEEYGIERLKQAFQQARTTSAHDLCADILRHVSEFVEQQKRRRFLGLIGPQATVEGDSLGENDITTVALVRFEQKSIAANAR
ncbi:MAG TPA: SpoIIE family protein phosphatase [Terriglobales bacterium]|nr:SpoIIE family protein phosphatase [Terriglobales bacterium]